MANIKPTDACLQANQAVTQHKRDFALYHIVKEDGKEQVVVKSLYPEQEGRTNNDPDNYQNVIHKAFVDAVLADEAKPCFASLDFRFRNKDGNPTDKVVVIMYNPDKGKIKDKMMAASSWQNFAQAVNVAIKIEANSPDQLSYDAVLARCNKV